MIANHGQVRRYYHDRVGVNSRLDAIQAVVLGVKLKHLDEYAAARQAAADFYDQALAGLDWLQTPVRFSRSTHVFHQYTLLVKNGQRDALQTYLQQQGIPTMIYYPVPLYAQDAFRPFTEVNNLPVTEQLCQEVLSLPIHTELDAEQLSFIMEAIKGFGH